MSMGFHRQDYWSGLPFPTPGDLPDPRIRPIVSPELQADSLPLRKPCLEIRKYEFNSREGSEAAECNIPLYAVCMQ